MYVCLLIVFIGLFVLFMNREYKNPEVHYINIRQNEFHRSEIMITPYDTIRFYNSDVVRHSFNCNHKDIPNTPLLYHQDTFDYTLTRPGNYLFESTLYPGMIPLSVRVMPSNKIKSSFWDRTFVNEVNRPEVYPIGSMYNEYRSKVYSSDLI